MHNLRRPQIVISSVSISIFTNLCPWCSHLTKWKDVIFRHQLSKHQASWNWRIEIWPVLNRKCWWPVISACYCQISNILVASSEFTVNTNHSLACSILREEFVFIYDVFKADCSLSKEIVSPVVKSCSLSLLSSVSQKEAKVKISNLFLEVQHQVWCKVLILRFTFAETAFLILIKYSTTRSYICIVSAVVCVVSQSVQNIEPVSKLIRCIDTACETVDVIRKFILVDNPVWIFNVSR